MPKKVNQQHQYRVLEQRDLFEALELVVGSAAGGGAAGGSGTGTSSAPPKTYSPVPAFRDHGVVTANSAHQARVQVVERLGVDKATLIVVRESNMLEDTLKKEPRFEIVSEAGQRRAQSRKTNAGNETTEDGPGPSAE